MSTLEDKILGNKLHNYCSSSESEEESGDEGSVPEEDNGTSLERGKDPLSSYNNIQNPSKWDGVSSNTGPKGVLKDWQRFKQLETEKRKEQEAERLALIKKLSITCKSNLDQNPHKKESDDELVDVLSDDFLEQYRKQRMNEMLIGCSKLPSFGSVFELANGEQFLKAVDEENKLVTVIVHIYEDRVSGCTTMNECLAELSREYIHVKFCKFLSTSAGMSNKFKTGGVPALLIYKGGQMVGNFVRLTNELGDEFYAGDIENFLVEHGMIIDKNCLPNTLYESKGNDEDSDLSLE